MTLDISNVSFRECQAYKQGSAFFVGSQEKKPDPKRGIRQLFASFRNMSVKNCSTPSTPFQWRNYGAICLFTQEVSIIEFYRVVWVGNGASLCSALFVGNTNGSVKMHINESLLVENYSVISAAICTATLVPEGGTITIVNTHIVRTSLNGMLLSPMFKIILYNVKVTSSKYAALMIQRNFRPAT